MSFYLAALGAIARFIDRPRRYVMPMAQGTGDGSSWANAAAITGINLQIALAAAAGGDVALRADAGVYPETALSLTSGGPVGGRVTIMGLNGDGTPGTAIFNGPRSRPWSPGGNEGGSSGLFTLNSGADRLGFSNIEFRNCGYGCIRFRQAVTDIVIEQVKGDNVRSLILNSAPSGQVAPATKVRIRDIDLRGFSKQGIYFRYDSSDIVIEDVFADSQNQQEDASNWASGFVLNNTAHDITFRRCTALNFYNDRGTGYWNGDGFSSERDNYNLLYEECNARNATDGGFDLKSSQTVLLRCHAESNKHNYRLWGQIDVIDCTGINPFKRGGSSYTNQVSAHTQSFVRVIGGSWTQNSSSAPFVTDGSGFLAIDLTAQVTRPNSAPLSRVDGTSAQFSVFDVNDLTPAVITSATTVAIDEGYPYRYAPTLSKPAVVVIDQVMDYTQASKYGKQVDIVPLDYEDPAIPSHQIKVQIRLKSANNVLSAPVVLTIDINDMADDPIGPGEVAGYATNGCWFEIRPDTVFADVAMTVPAQPGDFVAAVKDLSGFNNPALQPEPVYQATFESDGAGNYWLELDGSQFYEVGAPGEFRFPQVTALTVFDRRDDDEARRYLFSFPRSNSDATDFNSSYTIGVLSTQSLWGRAFNNQGTSATGGASRFGYHVASLRSTDGVIRSDKVQQVQLPAVATIGYVSGVASRKLRLFAEGDPTPGGFFAGKWVGGAFYNAGLPDDIRNRVEKQLGTLGKLYLP